MLSLITPHRVINFSESAWNPCRNPIIIRKAPTLAETVSGAFTTPKCSLYHHCVLQHGNLDISRSW